MATKTLDTDFIASGKTGLDSWFITRGRSHGSGDSVFILRGKASASKDSVFIASGKTGLDSGFVLATKKQNEAYFILIGKEVLPEAKTRRFTLLDRLKLRTTSVYRSPRDISVLRIAFGDFSSSRIPCTPLDRDGYLYHASDWPMQMISAVQVDGEPKSFGYKANPAWQDETGRAIACVIFDEPQYNRQVSISGKGAVRMDLPTGQAGTGELIENPADFIYAVQVQLQGYDESSVDLAAISRFRGDCLKAEIKTVYLLEEAKTVKEFFDELALNIHAHWMISDGKSVMRLRWL